MKQVPLTIEWLRSKNPTPENPIKVYDPMGSVSVTAVGHNRFFYDLEGDRDRMGGCVPGHHWLRPVETETRWVNYYGDSRFAHEYSSKKEAELHGRSHRIACFSYEKEVE